MSTSCPNCGKYNDHKDVCEKCGYNYITQKTKDGKTLDHIVPNNVKSVLGEWYPFSGKFKIEKAKSDTDENPQRFTPYVLTVTFPNDARTGFYPRDMRLASEDGQSTSYYYNGYGTDENRTKHLLQRIKDLQRYNSSLIKQNRELSKHFSLTWFEKEQQEQKERRMRFDCDHCGDPIDKKILIEGKDFIETEDGALHLKCAYFVYNSFCTNCSLAYSSDERTCDECGEALTHAEKKEMIDFLTFDAIKKHLPEELRDKVILKIQRNKK